MAYALNSSQSVQQTSLFYSHPMNRWGSRQTAEPEGINFAEELKAHSTAHSLLQLPNLVQQVKCKAQKFTQVLLQPAHKLLLEQLIRLAINPQAYLQHHNQLVDNKATHAAIEILSNLSEEFIEHVFEDGVSQEDEVIQIERDYPILSFILKVLREAPVEETGLAYFSKIITPFIYQRPEEIIKFFSNQGLSTIVDFFWSSSVAELVSKILQAENESDFYQKEKLSFFGSFLQEIAGIDSQEKVEKMIENFGELLESLVQKHEDKYEKAKYQNLIRKIMKQSGNFHFLLDHLAKYSKNQTITTELLHCLEASLRICEPQKPGSKAHQEEAVAEPIAIDQEFKQKLHRYLSQQNVTNFVSDKRLQLLNYYKVIKKAISVLPELTADILTKQFLAETLAIMKAQPNNNILHNFQKEVVLLGVQQSPAPTSILLHQLSLAQTIQSSLTETNSKISYHHQLFIIGQAVRAKSQESSQFTPNWSGLEQPFKNKRAFYSMLIGGNPRDSSDKWGSFQQQMVLKPLEKKEPTPAQQLKHKERNASYQMVTRLDELEGTEVLSEEEDEAFPADKQDTNNAHFFDDLGMPDLPLDSDRSQQDRNQGSSFDQLPMTLKQNSFQEEAPEDLKEKNVSHDSSVGAVHPNVERTNSIVAIDLGQPSEQLTESSKLEEDFRRDAFAKSQQKRDSNLIEQEAELTVSVNIQEDDFVMPQSNEQKVVSVPPEDFKQKPQIPHGEEIDRLLQARYQLTLKESDPHCDQMVRLLLNRYGISLSSQ